MGDLLVQKMSDSIKVLKLFGDIEVIENINCVFVKKFNKWKILF